MLPGGELFSAHSFLPLTTLLLLLLLLSPLLSLLSMGKHESVKTHLPLPAS